MGDMSKMPAKASASMAAGKVSPRKRMAGAMMSGNMGVKPMVNPKGMATPGPSGMMMDSGRAVGMPVSRGKGMHPAQANPKHS